MAQDVNINIKANSGDAAKNLGELKKELEFTNQAAKDLNATFEQVYGEGLQPLSGRIGEAEDRLYELAAAGRTNTKEFEELSIQVAEMKKVIVDVDNSVDDLAANRGLATFGTQIGGISESLMTLDFDRAAKQAQTLAKSASGISFDKAIGSIKNLGSTFINLGKALLANPIFLIAAVIAAIVAAVIKLMDEIGLLKVITEAIGKVFEWIMKPINALIDGLKKLTDWFGWTANAAEEAAEKQAAAAEKAAKSYGDYAKGRIQDLDNEIRMMELQGKSTEKLEKTKLEVLKKTAAKEKEAAEAALKSAKLKGDLDEEELQALKDKVLETKLAYDQSIADIKYFNAQVKKEAQDLKDQQKKEREEEAKRIKEENAAKYEEWLAQQKEYNEKRLQAERQAEDLSISLIEDETERALEANRVKYERLIEDTKSNEDLLASEKKAIIDYYEQLQAQDEQKILEDKAAKDEAELQKQYDREDAQYKRLQELRNSDKENEIAAIVEKYEKEFELAEGNAELEKALKEQQEADLAAIEEKYRQQKEQAEKDLADKLKAQKEKEFNDTVEFGQKAVVAIGSLSDAIFSIKKRNLEKGSAEELKAAKQQFNVNKALQLSTATITGIKTVMDAYNNGMKNPIPLLGPATGIAYAITAGITSAANIAKIAASKFEGGAAGGGATIGSAPSTSGGAAATPPTFEPSQFFGLGQGTSTPGGGGQSPMKVYVTETDISKTQNKVQVIEDRAKIG